MSSSGEVSCADIAIKKRREERFPGLVRLIHRTLEVEASILK